VEFFIDNKSDPSCICGDILYFHLHTIMWFTL